MTATTNAPYWVVASRMRGVLSQVIAASQRLILLKLNYTPNIIVTNIILGTAVVINLPLR